MQPTTISCQSRCGPVHRRQRRKSTCCAPGREWLGEGIHTRHRMLFSPKGGRGSHFHLQQGQAWGMVHLVKQTRLKNTNSTSHRLPTWKLKSWVTEAECKGGYQGWGRGWGIVERCLISVTSEEFIQERDCRAWCLHLVLYYIFRNYKTINKRMGVNVMKGLSNYYM